MHNVITIMVAEGSRRPDYRRELQLQAVMADRQREDARLRLEPGYPARDVREVYSRISEAFFMYDRYLREAMWSRTNREIRLIGVLHPLPEDAPQHLRDVRDIVASNWRNNKAVIIDGSQEAVESGLKVQAEWVREVSRSCELPARVDANCPLLPVVSKWFGIGGRQDGGGSGCFAMNSK